MAQRQVPTLSLQSFVSGSESEKSKFVLDLETGLKEYGFIILKDHTVDYKKVDHFYECIHKFYQMPLDTKMKYCDEVSKKQRGYIPFGMEHAKDNPNPDLKEFWHVGREIEDGHELQGIYPKNVWPSEIEGFKDTALELYRSMDVASKLLLEAIGMALDVPKDYFSSLTKDGNSILRAIHYPPVKDHDTANSVRAAAHGDINLITMLVGARGEGLELLDRDGTWLPVNCEYGEIIVDTGDMMERITNHVFPATIHRVVNPKEETSTRYSMPFFVHPRPDAELKCIPSCVGKGAKYPPITSHEFLMERLKDIGLM